MSYNVWMQLTDAGIRHRRSSALKRVDRAIQDYWKDSSEFRRREVSRHFAAWKATKGAAWKVSIRNQRGGLDRLEKSLKGRAITEADEIGFAAIRESQQIAVDQLFHCQKVEMRNTKLQEGLKVANRVASLTKQSRGWTGTAHNESFVKQGLNSLVGGMMGGGSGGGLGIDMSSLERELAEKIVGSSIPIFSVVADAGMALLSIGQAARAQYSHYQSAKAGDSLRIGQPREALKAVLRIIDRERNVQLAKAATNLVSAATRAALSSVPAGQFAVGTVKSAVELMQHLYVLSRDVRERRAANQILSSGYSIPFSVIEDCPILGCYFLTCVPTSHVVNLALRDMGVDGWQTEVEAMRKQIDPAIQQAHRLINEHALVIPGLAHYKGGLGHRAKTSMIPGRVGKAHVKETFDKTPQAKEGFVRKAVLKVDKIKAIYNTCTLS